MGEKISSPAGKGEQNRTDELLRQRMINLGTRAVRAAAMEEYWKNPERGDDMSPSGQKKSANNPDQKSQTPADSISDEDWQNMDAMGAAMLYVDGGEKLTREAEEAAAKERADRKNEISDERWQKADALDAAMMYVDGGEVEGASKTEKDEDTKGQKNSASKEPEVEELLNEVGDLVSVKRSEEDLSAEAVRRARERMQAESRNRNFILNGAHSFKDFWKGLVGKNDLIVYAQEERRRIAEEGMGGETEAMQRMASKSDLMRNKAENESRNAEKLGHGENKFLQRMMDAAMDSAKNSGKPEELGKKIDEIVKLERAKMAAKAGGQDFENLQKTWLESLPKDAKPEQKADAMRENINRLARDYSEKYNMVDNFDRLTEQVPKLLKHNGAQMRVEQFFKGLGDKQMVTGEVKMGLGVREDIDAKTNKLMQIAAKNNWQSLGKNGVIVALGAFVGAKALRNVTGAALGGALGGAAVFGGIKGWQKNKRNISKEMLTQALNGGDDGRGGVMAAWRRARMYGGLKNAKTETKELSNMIDGIGANPENAKKLSEKLADLMMRREIEGEGKGVNLFAYDTGKDVPQKERMVAVAKQQKDFFEMLDKAQKALPLEMQAGLAEKVKNKRQEFEENQIKTAKRAQLGYKVMGAAIGATVGAAVSIAGREASEKIGAIVKEQLGNLETGNKTSQTNLNDIKDKYGIDGKVGRGGNGEKTINYNGEKLNYDGKFEMTANNGEKMDIDWTEKHGGYSRADDPFFAEDKIGGARPDLSFGNPLDGGNYETAADFENATEEWLDNIGNSPEQTALMAAYTGLAGEVDTYQEVQELADALRSNPELFDELRNAVPAKIENMLEDGHVDLRIIEQGEMYPSVYIGSSSGNLSDPNSLDLYIDKGVTALDKVHVLMYKDKSGHNILDNKAFRQINGIPEGRDISDQGICGECGGQSTFRQVVREQIVPPIPNEPEPNTPSGTPPGTTPPPEDTPEPGVPPLAGKTPDAHAHPDSVIINENSDAVINRELNGQEIVHATPDNHVEPSVEPGAEIRSGDTSLWHGNTATGGAANMSSEGQANLGNVVMPPEQIDGEEIVENIP